jgi:hypothetical protein
LDFPSIGVEAGIACRYYFGFCLQKFRRSLCFP